jgi:hypothetical protein
MCRVRDVEARCGTRDRSGRERVVDRTTVLTIHEKTAKITVAMASDLALFSAGRAFVSLHKLSARHLHKRRSLLPPLSAGEAARRLEKHAQQRLKKGLILTRLYLYLALSIGASRTHYTLLGVLRNAYHRVCRAKALWLREARPTLSDLRWVRERERNHTAVTFPLDLPRDI